MTSGKNLDLPREDEKKGSQVEKTNVIKYANAGPSPAEADALVWAAIDEAAQRNRCAGARALNNFIRDTAIEFKTKKGDENTNIIDQGQKATFAFDNEHIRRLFQYLDVCRLEGSTAHFSEKQGSVAKPFSGLMLDFDMIITSRKPALTDRHYYRLAGSLAARLQRDIDFATQLPSTGRNAAPVETQLHMFFIVKPETRALPMDNSDPNAKQLYKYGLHILVPGVKLRRTYKKWLLREFCRDGAVITTMSELGAVGEPSECLDQNSASVPVLFFGSCKNGVTVPYTLGAALEVTIDIAAGSGDWVPPPVIKRLGSEELDKFNLVAELSLNYNAEYEDEREPLVCKFDFECRPEIQIQAQDWGERSAGNVVDAEELLLADNSLSTLTLHNIEARQIHALLGLLSPDFYTERNKWRDVVFALANTSDQYKPLAIWYSHKCRHRSRPDSRIDDLDAVWDDAIASRGNRNNNPLTIRSIVYWARTSNPERYQTVREQSYHTMISEYAYAHGGRLEHAMIAKILQTILSAKFVVDVGSGAKGNNTYCWYEFVLPGQSMRPGEVWKWRKEVQPDDIHLYMSEKLTLVFDSVLGSFDERMENADNEDQAKYYKNLSKSFAASKLKLYNDTFKNAVIRQAEFLFRRRGFGDLLDNLTDLFGVSTGVLKLGRRCTLIDHFHEHPISRFTPVAFTRFNPDKPDFWSQLALDGIAGIIVEPDARDWILFHACQGLSGETKDGLYLLWEGGGQNGKTSFLRWVAKALGPYADKFNIQLMCSDREDSDKPNSAMMKFKYLNWAYSEESNKAQSLNVGRMKEMVNAGEVSGRDLNSKQETFTMKSNLVSASQYSFIVDTTDHGTWRRIKHYTSKTKFRRNPDPNNPFEKKDDPRFNKEYSEDPRFLSAFLGILVHYYERLQSEFDGRLKNVPCPTIDHETEVFRVSQDSLHRWICECVVVSPDSNIDYPLGVLSGLHHDWYSNNIERRRHVAGEVIKEIESSALSKYLRPAPNHTMILRGCRVLTADDMDPRPGEEFISVAEQSNNEWIQEKRAREKHGIVDKWWNANQITVPEANKKTIDESDIWFDDDAEFVRVDRLALGKDNVEANTINDDDIATLLESGGLPGAREEFTYDDVYG